jgi:hypothetical protein
LFRLRAWGAGFRAQSILDPHAPCEKERETTGYEPFTVHAPIQGAI